SASETRTISPAATSHTETFTVTVTPLPAAGGTLTFNASARDAAGNIGNATGVSVRLADVVPPDVVSVAPVNGATNVDPFTSIVVRFSEPTDRATLNGASIQLLRGSTVVATSLVIGGNDDQVTL